MGSKRSKQDTIQVSKITEILPSLEAISFSDWFHKKVLKQEIRRHQEREIKTFFSEVGLKDIETESKFEDTLKIF